METLLGRTKYKCIKNFEDEAKNVGCHLRARTNAVNPEAVCCCEMLTAIYMSS
jgi:hypothetical protein